MADKPAAKKLKPIGVYLRKNVRAEAEKIAAKEGLTLHATIAYAVSDFVRRYKAGKVKVETTKKPTPNLDI